MYEGTVLLPYLVHGASWGVGVGLIAWLTGFAFEYIVKLFKIII